MQPPDVPDYYLVLGIKDDASEKAVRTAYKNVALKFHPDKHGGNGEAMQQVYMSNDPRNSQSARLIIFQKVNEAYEILGDVGRRYDYDSNYPALKRKWARYWAWKVKADMNKGEQLLGNRECLSQVCLH